MSTVNVLVFRGSLQNEGNIWALESQSTIIIIGAGKDNPYVVKSILNIDYLKENRKKIKAVLIINSSPKNSGNIQNLYDELELNVPIYGSKDTKLNLEIYYECKKDLLNNFIEVDAMTKDILIDDFFLSFFFLDSFFLGNIGILIYNDDYAFYYLEDFSFNVLSNNKLLFKPFFFQRFRKFLSLRRKRTYFITGLQNLNWNNNGSLSLESKKFIIKDKEILLFIYDFDLLHIVETLEIAKDFNLKVNVLDKKMFKFLRRVFEGNFIYNIIESSDSTKKEKINLLTLNDQNMKENASSYIDDEKKYLLVSCLFPMSGGAEKLARFVDYLHSKNNEFLELGKSENLSIGANFYDLKFILKNLNPNGFISLQNSYKHEKYLNELKPFKPIMIPNCSYFNLNLKKVMPIKTSRQFLNTENLLLIQREKLLKSGLLVIFLTAFWQDEKLNISKIRANSLSISTTIDLNKIEKRIKQWWETKIITDFSLLVSDSNIKQNIERRLSGLLKNYLSFENDIEMEDPLFLVFIKK